MKRDFTSQLDIIDSLIREAQGHAAHQSLENLFKKGIPFGRECEVATLARRAHHPDLGIKLLHPIVRATGRKKREASTEDIIEYAACLIRVGALSEAKNLLKSIPDEKQTADAYFFEAGIYIKQWQYKLAIPLLHKFISHAAPTDYQKLVGKINLGLSFIFEKQFRAAKSLLGETIEEASGKNLLLLHANSLRLLGNLEVARGDWETAIIFFEQSARLLHASPGMDVFLCRKWVAISQFAKNPHSKEAEEKLKALRIEATQLRHWESIRDLDFYKAKALADNTLYEHLYFGTPFTDFRSRLLENWQPANLSSKYLWKLGDPQYKTTVDLFEGGPSPAGGRLKVGQTLHRLFLVLCSDFYRRFSIPELYEKIFPNEFYHPKVSELRVRQAILKLRRFLNKEKLPLLIEEEDGEYHLAPVTSVQILVSLNEAKPASSDPRLVIMKERLPLSFTSRDLCLLFKISRRTASDIILNAIKLGELERVGRGKRVSYTFKNCEPAAFKKTA